MKYRIIHSLQEGIRTTVQSSLFWYLYCCLADMIQGNEEIEDRKFCCWWNTILWDEKMNCGNR